MTAGEEDETTADDAPADDVTSAEGDDRLHRDEYRWGGSALASIAALLLAAVIGWVVVRPDFSAPRDDGDQSVLVRDRSRVAPAGSPTTTLPATTTTAAVDPFTLLPPGMKCSEIKAWGGTYEDAVRYWNRTGQPESLDQDDNGAPCEATFSKNDVIEVLGTIPPDDGSTTTTTTTPGSRKPEPPAVANLPGGLNCGQLRSRGYGADDAVAYYLAEGRPGRMDADGNGIPCETVFSDAAAAWHRR